MKKIAYIEKFTILPSNFCTDMNQYVVQGTEVGGLYLAPNTMIHRAFCITNI